MSKLQSLSLLASLPLFLSLGACGSDADDGDADPRAASARQAWQATQSKLEEVGSTIVARSAARLAQVGAGGTETLLCSGGGNVVMVDNTTVDVGDLAAIVFEWDASFTDCVEGEDTIDGSVNYQGRISVDGASSSVTLDYVGSLQYAGDFDDDCTVDIHTAVTSSSSGNSVSITGSFCGIAADEIATYNEAAING